MSISTIQGSKQGVNKITIENYAARTAGMESLIWEPTEKNLKAR